MGITLDGFPQGMVDYVKRVRALVKPVLEGYLGEFGGLAGVPVPFWGALTINETGPWIIHNLDVPSRHEPGVQGRLEEVLAGQRVIAYGLTEPALRKALQTENLHDISSSFGLTQVMGYHAVLQGEPVLALDKPETHFNIASKVMQGFLRQFQLDPTRDFPEMAHCWNAGSPAGKTFDPKYESNLMVHKHVWELLDNETTG